MPERDPVTTPQNELCQGHAPCRDEVEFMLKHNPGLEFAFLLFGILGGICTSGFSLYLKEYNLALWALIPIPLAIVYVLFVRLTYGGKRKASK